MTPEQQRLREIEEQLRQARPPYDLIPCDEPDCDRAFIGVRGDAGDDCNCSGFRREDAIVMTRAPETEAFLLALLREREEEIRRLRTWLEDIRDHGKLAEESPTPVSYVDAMCDMASAALRGEQP